MISTFGIGIHWLILILVLSVLFAFALRDPMGVVI